MTQTQILSVAALRHMPPQEVKNYKAEINKLRLSASTDLEREAYTNQLERVNQILNEWETDATRLRLEDKAFTRLEREIDQVIMEAV